MADISIEGFVYNDPLVDGIQGTLHCKFGYEPGIFCTIKQFPWKKWERTQNSQFKSFIGFGLLITTAKNYTLSHNIFFFLSSWVLLLPEFLSTSVFHKNVKVSFLIIKKNVLELFSIDTYRCTL